MIETTPSWPVQTRAEAAQRKQSRYYTGRTCKRKHVSQRYVSSGLCVKCVALRSRRFRVNTDGLVQFNAMVHPDDVQTLTAVVDNMNKKRR